MSEVGRLYSFRNPASAGFSVPGNDRLWPVFTVAQFINNRNSGCVERQVTGPFRSYSRGLYKRSVKEQNRPTLAVQLKILNGNYARVSRPSISATERVL